MGSLLHAAAMNCMLHASVFCADSAVTSCAACHEYNVFVAMYLYVCSLHLSLIATKATTIIF